MKQQFHLSSFGVPGMEKDEKKKHLVSCLRTISHPWLNEVILFQYISHDLSPWIHTGISKHLILTGKPLVSFRVTIVHGRRFVEPFLPCYQTRAFFTVWGIAQLLNYYPGMVPDLDLLFSCDDQPQISKEHQTSTPIPLFGYCSIPEFYDIAFPNWSFWGWPEINVRSWDVELADIVNRSKSLNWADRDPTTYWKGNPYVAPLRQQLLTCNSSEFGTRLLIQDWNAEEQSGYLHSKLSDECKNRWAILC